MAEKHFLDDREALEKLDKSGVLATIEQLANQCQEVWATAQTVKVPTEYSQVRQVVVAGMGGSILGTHIIQTVFKDELKVPVLIVPDYTLPEFVDENTLVIASSYSGTTEETISALNDAKQRGAKIAGITSGNEVARILEEWQLPCVVFPTTYNVSGQPRMGLGYSVFGQMILFAKCGLLEITEEMYEAVLAIISDAHLQFAQSVGMEKNAAKLLAFEMLDKIPVITIAEHLEGVGHVLANQLNENAKTYSEYRVIPELNHHLMEGLQFPAGNGDHILFFTVESELYSKNNSLRLSLTEEVLEKHTIEVRSIKLSGKTKLEQAFELLVFGSYASFYLAMLHNIDPANIPWVDWFKSELKKQH